MGTKSINKQLDELADLFVDMFTYQEMFELDEHKKSRVNELMPKIRSYLVENPGELIYEKDTASITRKNTVIDFLWKVYNDEDHYDEIFGGDNTDFITNFVGDYLKRAKMIRPTYFSVRKSVGKDFEVFFKEAIKSWLYGCKHAAIIICNSLLEDLLRNKLCDINDEYAHKLFDWNQMKSNSQYGMKDLKKFAKKEGILNQSLIEKLTSVQQTRNNCVHNLNTVSDEEAYERIIDTKDIVEYLLNNK